MKRREANYKEAIQEARRNCVEATKNLNYISSFLLFVLIPLNLFNLDDINS